MSTLLRAAVLSLALGASNCIPASAADAPVPELKAGAAAVEITPERFPVIVNGMFTERSATRAHDPLYCRCLVLEDGRTTIAITIVDSCMMPRELLDLAKEQASVATGIPTSNMLIAATHTHSAPAAMGCLGSDADPVYPAFLQTQIARCITLAAKNRERARLTATTILMPWLTHNRRWIYRSDRMLVDPFGERTVRANMHPGYMNPNAIGPSGPVDPELSLLVVKTFDRRPIAVLANLSMHYFGSPILSADYFGVFSSALAKKISKDKPPVVMMSQGTSGDLMWMDYGMPKSELTMEQYAQNLVQLAARACDDNLYASGVPIAVREIKQTFERRVPDESRLKWAEKIVADLKGKKPTTQPEIYAREQVLLHENPRRELKLQAIRIGNVGIAAIPNEVFAITGLEIKARSPLNTFVIELANGAEGYIPPPAQHALGGYTTWPARTAALEVQAEPKIVETLIATLEELAEPKRKARPLPPSDYEVLVANSKPLAYWRFHEFRGPSAMDVMGKHQGSYESGVAFYLDGPPAQSMDMLRLSSLDVINRAVHFAGGRVKAKIPELGQRYSIEGWLWNGFPNNERPVTGYFFSRGPDGDRKAPGDHFGIGGTAGNPGKLIFFNGNERNQVLAGKRDIDLRTWHHVVLTRDGAKVRVYLNGALEIDGTADLTLPPGNADLFLGGRCDSFAGLEGRLDEVAVYDRLLTADEIRAHWTSGSSK